MSERIIIVEGIDPVELYGVNNALFDRLTERFPKIKIVACGDEIIFFGADNETDEFESKLLQLVDSHAHRDHITIHDVDRLFSGEPVECITEKPTDVIVYGTDGRVIRVRAMNQKKLMESYEKNDLLFATCPAVEAGERLGLSPSTNATSFAIRW